MHICIFPNLLFKEHKIHRDPEARETLNEGIAVLGSFLLEHEILRARIGEMSLSLLDRF